ncbi:DUF397 domain-containing protein [Streptomonospora arabica]
MVQLRPRGIHVSENKNTSRLATETWIKSTYSAAMNECCELLFLVIQGQGVVSLRDSTDRNGANLSFPCSEWTALLAVLADAEGGPDGCHLR